MKKVLIIFFLVPLALASCTKFLDREPLTQISPDNAFSSESELKLYVQSFYGMFPTADAGYPNGIYNETFDNIILNSLNDQLAGTRVVPVTDGNWAWGNLRNINFFLVNYPKGHLPDNITAPYVGAARFFRAYFYFNMVALYGDVPWISTVIDANDSVLLTKPRDARKLVMDSVLADLDYAIGHMTAAKAPDQVSKWTAMALKSRVCLFEGTFRKYHAGDPFDEGFSDANTWLQRCADVSDSLIKSNQYKLHVGNPSAAYGELFSQQSPDVNEYILARTYSAGLAVFHNLNYYTVSPSYGKPGLEKKLVNSYLMKDGSRFTDIPGYDTITFFNEIQNRDPRLAQTIRTPGYTRIGTTNQLPPDFSATVTGYQLTKFVSDPSQDANQRSVTPLPIFRYAEVLLNYAEAMAELNAPDPATYIGKSVNVLRSRVGMPPLDPVAANANPDTYLGQQDSVLWQMDPPNKGLLLEIRRERRIELVMESFRWNDLMRWKEGHLMRDVSRGMYFPGAGSYDLDLNGKIDVVIYTDTKPPAQNGVVYLKLGSDIDLEHDQAGGNIVVNRKIGKLWREDRDYLFPIPQQEITLNGKITQNPHW